MKTGLVKQTIFIPTSPAGGNAIPPGNGSATPQGSSAAGKSPTASRVPRTEYLLVVYPYGDLQDRLLAAQQQFSSDYGLQMTVRNKPHITLAVFQAGEEMEDTLIRWIQRICTQHKNFEITLNNFSGIPPHTIYLRVQDPQPFRELTQQLRAIDDFILSSGGSPVNLASRPYLSIAGGLTEQVYNKAMPDYSRKTFHGIFRVDELVLLKRGHSFDACKTVNIFRLLPDLHQPNQSPA